MQTNLTALLLLTAFVTFSENVVRAQRPSISSFSPESARIGTSVTINGSGFSADPAKNILYVGAVKVAVKTASSGFLTFEVPAGAGYGPLRLVNKESGRSCTSSGFFNLTFPSKKFIAEADFAAGVNLNPLASGSLVAADVNNDGKSDLVCSHKGISVYINKAEPGAAFTAASFFDPVTVSETFDCSYTQVKDLNGDGLLDIISLSSLDHKIRIYKNKLSGSFSSTSLDTRVDISLPASGYWSDFICEDVDGDGKPDLILSNSSNNAVYILRNISSNDQITSQSFATPQTLVTGTYPSGLEVADINKDGKPEILAVCLSARTASVFNNNSTSGTLSFSVKVDFSLPNYGPNSAFVADIDKDGRMDIVIGYSSNSFTILPGLKGAAVVGTDSFAAAVSVSFTEYGYGELLLADVDGDDKVDISACNTQTNHLIVLRNICKPGSISSESFLSSPKIKLATGTFGCILADLNNDGLLDIPSIKGTSVSLIRNISAFPPVVLDCSESADGKDLLIRGAYFNKSAERNAVFIGNERIDAAEVLEGDALLRVRITESTPSGRVRVTNLDNNLSAIGSVTFRKSFKANSNFTNADFKPCKPLPKSISDYYAFLSAAGDLDGDGKADIVSVSYESSTVSIYRNITTKLDEEPVFASAVTFTAVEANGLFLEDINRDGKLDLHIRAKDYGSHHIWLNNCNPGNITASSFVKPSYTGNSISFNKPVFEDIDKDGKVDFIQGVSSGLMVYRNVSGNPFGGSILEYATIKSLYRITNVAAGDFNNDGLMDLAAIYDYGLMSIFLNTSDWAAAIKAQGFATQIDIPLANTAKTIVVDDLNGDGKPEILLISSSDNHIGIYHNKFNGTSFTSSSLAGKWITTNNFPEMLKVADMNGDKKPELIFSNSFGGISVIKNSFLGELDNNSFSSEFKIPTFGVGTTFEITDLNVDGKPDIFINGGRARMILNDPSIYEAPVIKAFSPQRAPVGATVKISGSNFNAVADSNYVRFGFAKATVIKASTTELDVMVPPGADTKDVFVLNKETRLTGFSSQPFYVTFPSKKDITISDIHPFIAYSMYGDYGNVITDLDNDGRPDILGSTGKYSNNFFACKNQSRPGKISFFDSVKASYLGLTSGNAIGCADIDQDGREDFLMTDSLLNKFYVFRNKGLTNQIGSGNLDYDYKAEFPCGPRPVFVATGDLNNDGKLDVVTCNGGNNTISVLANSSVTGAFSFDLKSTLMAGINPVAVEIADLDNDGKQDLIVVNKDSGNLYIFKNSTLTGGSVNFDNAFILRAGIKPMDVKAADFNNDGKQDLIIANSAENNLLIYVNISSGSINSSSFATSFSIPAGDGPCSITVNDFDGDGFSDIGVANAKSKTISLIRNTATFDAGLNAASFAVKIDLKTGYSAPLSINSADLDSDGKTDIFVSNKNGEFLAFKNDPVIPPTQLSAPVIYAVYPSMAVAGSVINISGDRFNEVASLNTVLFGTLKAQIVSGSKTLLSVKVPVGAGIETISVINQANRLSAYSLLPFKTIYTAQKRLSSADFEAKKDYLHTDFTTYFNTGDINGDGKIDIVVANNTEKNISVLINQSVKGSLTSTSFVKRYSAPTADEPTYVKIADLNGDAKPEIIVIDAYSSSIRVFINYSEGEQISFSSPFSIPVENGVRCVAIGDLDGDGRPDLIAAIDRNLSHYGISVRVFQNLYTGGTLNSQSFTAAGDFPVGTLPADISIGDLNKDGKPDIVVACDYDLGELSILQNKSIPGRLTAASFYEKLALPLKYYGSQGVLVDINNDEKLDIISEGFLFQNDSGTGEMGLSSFVSNGKLPYYNAVGDLDGNGKPDLVGISGIDKLGIAVNNATSSSVSAVDFSVLDPIPSSQSVQNIYCKDMDGDGKQDIIINSSFPRAISIFRNNIPGDATVLPVRLKSYTAQRVQGSAVLNWETSSELNNRKFVLSRSNDQKEFKEIYEQVGAASSAVNLKYSFTDLNPIPGDNYYKLEQEDSDGSRELLGIKQLAFPYSINVSPNPTLADCMVTFQSDVFSKIQLIAEDAKIVMTDVVTPGMQHYKLNVSAYPAGTYMVNLIGKNKRATVKIIKL